MSSSGGGDGVGEDMVDGSEIKISPELPRVVEGACLEMTLHRKRPQDDTLGDFADGGSKQEAVRRSCGCLSAELGSRAQRCSRKV